MLQYPAGYYSLRTKKIQSVDIALEHDIDEQYQYAPGEELKGSVVIKLNESVKVNNIQLQIKGEGTVSWDHAERNKTCAATETYIDISETLVRSSDGESLLLSKGVHEFPFYHQLPSNLPSSFIGKYGSVTYLVRATMNPERKYGDQTITSEPFLVLRPLDLARYPDKLLSYECDAEKKYYGICCFSGKLKVMLQTNRQAFTPGEDIVISAEISNGSPKLVTALQVSFIMNSIFYAQKEMMTNTQIISKKRDEYELTIGEGRRWNSVHLAIPPYVPETQLDYSRLIDVSYELLFQVELHGCTGMNILLPIIIGTRGLPANFIPMENGIDRRHSKQNPLWHPMEHQQRHDETTLDPETYEPLPEKEDSEIGSINMEDFSYGDDRFQSKAPKANNNYGGARYYAKKKKRQAPTVPSDDRYHESTHL